MNSQKVGNGCYIKPLRLLGARNLAAIENDASLKVYARQFQPQMQGVTPHIARSPGNREKQKVNFCGKRRKQIMLSQPDSESVYKSTFDLPYSTRLNLSPK